MLDHLLKNDGLTVAFQPIFHLRTGNVFAHEVLGRVRPTPENDPAPGPAELLERACSEGRLLDIEHRWRSLAIAAIARSKAPGFFFLNVDTRILDDLRFLPGTTSRLLERHRLQRSRFVFEITERDPELRARRLSELLPHYSAQGYGIALDDLGVGHSSLAVLVQLKPDIVKLDRAQRGRAPTPHRAGASRTSWGCRARCAGKPRGRRPCECRGSRAYWEPPMRSSLWAAGSERFKPESTPRPRRTRQAPRWTCGRRSPPTVTALPTSKPTSR